MFWCCCPKEKSSDIQQKLIQKVEQSSSTLKRDTQLSNQYSEKNMKNKQENIGYKPSFQSQPIGIIKKQQQQQKQQLSLQQDKIMRQIILEKAIKSNVWQFQNLTQIVYYNFEQKKQLFLTFVICKRGKNSQKTSLLQNLIRRSSQSLSLVIPSNLSNFLHEGKHSNINNTNVIFGSFHKQIQRKLSRDDDNFSSKSISGYFQHRAGQIFQIQRLDRIRQNAFDQIYISVQNQYQKQSLKKFCSSITSTMSLQDLKRINYIFPCYMRFQDIALIIYQRMRKYVLNQSILKIVNSLFFEIELFQTAKGNSIMIVSHKKRYSKKSQINDDKQFVNIGIGLLMLQLADSSYRIYSTLINSLKNEKLADYISMKRKLDLSRTNKQEFLQKLRDLKQLNSDQINNLDTYYDTFNKIKQCKIQKNQTSFIINPTLKQKIGKIVQGYNSPGFQNTPVKKQWDDDLKQSDLPMPSRQSYQPQSGDMDLLNRLDETQIQDTKLQGMIGQQQQQGQQYDLKNHSVQFEFKNNTQINSLKDF